MLRNMHGNQTTLVVTSKHCVSTSLASLHFNQMIVFSKTIEQHLFQSVRVASNRCLFTMVQLCLHLPPWHSVPWHIASVTYLCFSVLKWLCPRIGRELLCGGLSGKSPRRSCLSNLPERQAAGTAAREGNPETFIVCFPRDAIATKNEYIFLI